ncbi:DUF1615 domain-containing protein [Aquincola sp. S2]|uniref:DUF1615 domain-containing protein n=1 Tax=Pseudaquabacterium terrae TaxID=2732868 RepID=A0ABX2EAI5_9BURK|nr:DUF1615 domain-containing protein [Aquabacterium terrae]NRF65850.1 DUF1615 domain-containing protein [Aquabacterium terrae]
MHEASTRRRLGASLLALAAALLAACASEPPKPAAPTLRPDEARALITRAIPERVSERRGWATDTYAAFASLELPVTRAHLCAALAVIEQESSYQVNPRVPGLAAIAWREIDAKAERLGLPSLVVRTALKLASPDGRSYAERIDAATTEGELSKIFDDLIERLPMGQRLFGRYNPVRTGGPMQVSIAWAEAHAQRRPYPYPAEDGLRDEVFTRRGGLYFGIAHLLDYEADYDALIFRYADFNAGHYASRNAALQNAISTASGIPLDPDGDLIAHDREASKPGSTELAARTLGRRLDLSEGAIRRALEQGDAKELERTAFYRGVFQLADTAAGRRLPRAVIPRIALKSPKITRPLTTEWFARRVDERQQRCLARMAADPA